jgi:hypothetical protein
MINQSEIRSRSQVQFITLFTWTTVLRLLPATGSFTYLVQKNQFHELNRQILTLSQEILLFGVTYWAPVEMLWVRTSPMVMLNLFDWY